MATPRSAREGRGLVTSFTSLAGQTLTQGLARETILLQQLVASHCGVWDQSQCSILSHEEIPVLRAAAAKVTRPLPSLAKRGVATQDYVWASCQQLEPLRD